MDHFNDTNWFNNVKTTHINTIIHYVTNNFERRTAKDYFIDDLSTITESSMDLTKNYLLI